VRDAVLIDVTIKTVRDARRGQCGKKQEQNSRTHHERAVMAGAVAAFYYVIVIGLE
jgi:hypothetical protein